MSTRIELPLDMVSLPPVILQCTERKVSTRRALLALAGMLVSLSLFRTLLSCAWKRQVDGALMQQQDALANRKRRLGDGCYNIYLDVGSNIGVHTRFLFEPSLYPNAKDARKVFDGEFGSDRDNRDFCSFGFEPNPIHVAHHHKLEAAYQALGWRYKFIPAGVSDQEGNLTFYKTDTKYESDHNDWGFSMVKRSDQAIPIQVPVIDLVDWIHENIAQRELPEIVYGNYTKPKVVMKLDIEGAEYAVLPALLFSGIMCHVIDFAFGEMHPHDAYRMQRNHSNPEEGRGAIKFENADEGRLWYNWVISKAYDSQPLKNCPGRWKLLDDEAYVRDTTRLPNVSLSSPE